MGKKKITLAKNVTVVTTPAITVSDDKVEVLWIKLNEEENTIEANIDINGTRAILIVSNNLDALPNNFKLKDLNNLVIKAYLEAL